jgi:gas vesicle protein
MKSVGKFLEGFILGGLVGVAAAVLIAPASGDELRGRIQGETQRIRDEVNQASAAKRAELEQQLAALRMPH